MRELIQNAKVHIDRTFDSADTADPASQGAQDQRSTQAAQNVERQKRPAQVAFGHVSWPPPQLQAIASVSTASSVSAGTSYQLGTSGGHHSVQTAHVYQTDLRNNSVYSGYMPGYDSWWSVLESQAEGSTQAGPVGQVGQLPRAGAGANPETMLQTASVGLPSQEFTFNTQHFSPEFLQAMRDPAVHFPSVFAHQGF